MRKLVILSVTGVLIAGGAGASAYYYVHNRANYYDQAIQSLRAGDVKRAQIQLRNAVRQNPSNASAHFQLAQVELGLGDAVAAEKDYRAALALGFDADAITPALAQTYLMQQRFRDLLADFPAVESPPELAARIDVLRALAYVRLNDPDNAAAAIDEAEKLAPTLTDVPLNAARIALSRQDRVTAERELNRTLKLDPRNAAALTLKAEMQRTRGDRDGAMKTIGLAVADTPEGIRARLTRAGFYIDDSQDADAKKDVDAVLEVEPQNLMATYLRGVLLTRAKDWPAADAVLTKVSQYASQLPKAYFFIAVVKSNTGQLEQAHDAASRYVARVPQDPEGVKLLARVAVDSKQPTDAIRVLNDAVTAGRADLEMLDLLGRAYTMAGRPTDAVATFEKAASLAPGNSDILARLASARADAAAVGSDGSDGVQKTSLQATPAPPAPTETSIVTALAIGDLGRASSEIDALRAKDGNTELVADLSARLKMAQLDLPGARSQLDTALKQFPDSVRLRLALARLAEIQLQPDQTERWLTEIVQRQPTSEPALAGLIGIMINSGRVNRAIALADAARKAAPAEATFPAMIADLQIRAGDAHTALAALNQVPKEMAETPAILGARARAQVALNQRADAEATYRRILASQPDDLNARARLVELLLADHDLAAAKTVVEDGLKRSPKNLGMMSVLVRIAAESGGFEAGLAQADAFLKDPATLPDSRVLKGDFLLASGKPADAVAAFAEQFRLGPSAVLASRLATAELSEGHPDAAVETLGDWTSNHARDLPVLLQLSSIQISKGDYDHAARTLELILAQRPGEATALNNLAWIYGMRKNPKAVDLARKAYVLAPTAETADTLGWNLTQVGKAQEALPLLKVAADRLQKSPAVQYHYGVALRDVGRTGEAEKELTLATTAPGDYPEKKDAQKALAELSAKH